MTRATLRTDIADYLHRTDFTDAQLDTFIDEAGIRIGQQLRSRHNSVDTTVATDSAGQAALAAGVVFVQSLRDPDRHRELIATTKPNLTLLHPTAGSDPLYYTVFGDNIEVYPNVAKTLEIQYFLSPVLAAADASVNDTLTAYPQLYRYAALVEAAIFTQDEPLIAAYRVFYQDEIDRINTAERDMRAPLTFGRRVLNRAGVRGI